VDERTVRRYATHLTDLGIPVVAERGRYGGYRLLPGYKLPPLMFTDDEATAVVLGLVAGRRLGLPGEAAESALAKIQRVLPVAVADRVQALRQTLGFTLPSRDGVPPAMRVALELAEAVRDGLRVRIGYRSWRGEESARDLDPYGLVFHSGRWYVTGLDHRSGQIRTFRLDRIATLQTTAEPQSAARPEGFDPIAHVTASLAAVPYTHQTRVLLETTLAEARKRLPRAAGTLEEAAGGVLWIARVEDLDGMARMLAGLGWPFTVREPADLRQAVARLATRLAGYADRN
jgi:predicted DNA-binding transcriptional regulator YafY